MRSSIKVEAAPPPQRRGGFLIDTLFMRKAHFLRTPRDAQIMSLVLGIVFTVLAIALLFVSLNVYATKAIYANKRVCVDGKQESSECSVTIPVKEPMKAPIYVLYYVENVYINHKKYLSSYNEEQLNGLAISAEEAEEDCKPIIFNKDLPFKNSWGGYPLNPDEIASPCGLKALLYFNDTFTLTGPSGQSISINQKDIYKGKAIKTKRQPQSEQKQWIDPQNEHFKLHMLDGSLMTKKRLWGRIEQDLPAGDYKMTAKNNYQISDMMIRKGLELTTTGALGGFNLFFPIAFAIAAVICFGYMVLTRVKLSRYQRLIHESYVDPE